MNVLGSSSALILLGKVISFVFMRLRSVMEMILSPRKAKRERLNPTSKIINAPVRFFIERGESFFLFPLLGFPSH